MRAGRSEAGPRARTEGLVVKTVGDEVLVYDLARHRAHSLNATAAAVWRVCDGTRTSAEIGTQAARDRGPALDPVVVDYALGQLEHAHLLADPGLGTDAGPRLTRRDLIRRGAMVVALPVVASILAPTAAQAQSCLPDGTPCSVDIPCCNGCNTLGGNVCELP